MQSIASRSLPDEEVLYQRKKITVTPSWLEVKNTSYAIRYIQKLTLKSIVPPRFAAGVVFVFALILSAWQVYRIYQETPPVALNWVLLVLCLLLLVISSYIAFAMSARYRLDIFLSNEAVPLQLERTTRSDILELHEAIALAMDWHRTEADPETRGQFT